MTNILVIGLKESCVNFLVEGNLTALALKSRLCSQEVHSTSHHDICSSTYFF